jgi:hypothetical protein
VHYSKVLAVAGLAALAAPACDAATIQPTAGFYSVVAFYKSVTPSGGASCPTAGSYAAYSFYYPGPGKTGANAHGSGLAAGKYVVGRINFSVTPAAGATTWKGSTVAVSSAGASSKATFTATLTYFDGAAFLANANWNEIPSTGGSCAEVIEFSYVKV